MLRSLEPRMPEVEKLPFFGTKSFRVFCLKANKNFKENIFVLKQKNILRNIDAWVLLQLSAGHLVSPPREHSPVYFSYKLKSFWRNLLSRSSSSHFVKMLEEEQNWKAFRDILGFRTFWFRTQSASWSCKVSAFHSNIFTFEKNDDGDHILWRYL